MQLFTVCLSRPRRFVTRQSSAIIVAGGSRCSEASRRIEGKSLPPFYARLVGSLFRLPIDDDEYAIRAYIVCRYSETRAYRESRGS